ncbi:MAG: hypothetical protein ACFFG0_36560 [Candidatus Thorarchaeota archaeon]
MPNSILDLNVYVNEKEIEQIRWSDFMVSSSDVVAITPYIGFLDTWEIDILENFYYMLQGRLYEKSISFTLGTTSAYAAHYKFLVDQVSSILLDYNILYEL